MTTVTRSVIGFDIEQYIPNGGEASIEHPISCAVTTPGLRPKYSVNWLSSDGYGSVLPVASKFELEKLAYVLYASSNEGQRVVTWHGAAYDFPCLARHTGLHEWMRYTALESIDLHILFMAVARHRLSLKAAAEACGSHKGGGAVVSGSEASTTWPEAWREVLDYCRQDVQATLDVYHWLMEKGDFTWKSSKGHDSVFVLPDDLRDPERWTVRHLLNEYQWQPAKSWITRPASPDDPMFAWMKS